MNAMVAWFARNHVAANLLMVTIIAGGLLTFGTIPKEVFPEFSADLITISVPYLGAAPAEVEEAVCARIEERIQDLEGIKELRSTAAEGIGQVTVEVERGTDARELLNDIKSRVDAIDTFPEETEKPIIQEVVLRKQVITVAIYGPLDEAVLKRLGERVRDDLSGLPGVSQVELAAARPYEISIEVSEDALRRHGLTFNQVAQAVRDSSLDLPGGSIRNRDGEILLRTAAQARTGAEFERLVLLTRGDGTRLVLGDVAQVVDGFAETDQSSRFDGQPAVLVQVFRVGDQSAIDIADQVKTYVTQEQARMPEGVSLTTWSDDTQVLRSRIELLLRNGRMGLMLVLLMLALFLKLRLAGWVSSGILVAFLGAFWLMPSFDVSINLISLFAFIVVLGIVVDDAIVVGENIFRHLEQGKKPLEAAVEGAQEVAIPVLFSVLTTIAAFYPLLSVDGSTGKIMRVIPLVVILTLVFSLLEALFVLPAHLAHTRHRAGAEAGSNPWKRLQAGVSRGLQRFIERVYQPSLEVAIRWRYATTAAAIAVLVLSLAMVAGGWIKFTFMPKIEADTIAAFVSMPQGTPAEVTERAVRRIQDRALELQGLLEAEGHHGAFRHVLASVGEQPYRNSQGHGPNTGQVGSRAHLGEVTIELAPAEARTMTSPQIVDRWREMVGTIPDATELVFASSLFSTGEAINVQFSGPSLNLLEQAAAELKERLREYPGVIDIADSFEPGKQEIKLRVTPEAEAMGIQLADVARQVRQAFYGEEAQRMQRGREEVKVMVRYPNTDRRSLGDLEEMRIRTQGNAAQEDVEVPFTTAAKVELGQGFAAIQRVDRHRTINVTADVDAQTNANEVIADLESRVLPQLLANYPGLRYSFEGEQQQQRETMGGLRRGFLFALLAIYCLLAIPFRSYAQPLIVMTAIPFGLVGAVWGHGLLGMDLTVLSMFSIVALTGVVVNDSLVMVDFINRAYRTGTPLLNAVREAGVARFRPILLTSLTTFVGLLPLLLEKSLQAKFLIPMAVSLAFGVLFATAITLILVPVCYILLEDFNHFLARLLGRSFVLPDGRAALASRARSD